MKAAAFALERPTTVEAALAQAQSIGAGARYLAGGQSLMPAMALRMASPEVLIDLSGIRALRGVDDRPEAIRVGALTTYREALHHPLLRQHVPLLAEAIPWIAHPAIRNAGTLGGSVALADPAAEMPALCLAMEATLIVRSTSGERRVPAARFFRGLYETALADGELLAAIEFPKTVAGVSRHFAEIARRRGDYASAGLVIHGGRAVLFGVSSGPVLLPPDRSLAGVEFYGDLYHSPSMKAHLTGVLLRRAEESTQGARS